jgi:sec-independent protein translocase protein TatA
MLAFFSPGPAQIVIFGVIILLLFGKRLPGVARSLGSSIVEFKKGVKSSEEDLDDKPDSENDA